MDQLLKCISSAKSIVVSTHRQCDGDGLGSQLAAYFGLKKIGKSVSIINVDSTPKKYSYLHPDDHIQYFDSNPALPKKVDLVIIFDTNDERMISPLYAEFKKIASQIAFVDHHPVLKKGPKPSNISWIDIKAASTGEMTYNLLKALNVPLDIDIAKCLYTSITFDTQLYRYIRNSPTSHLIAAELLGHDISPQEIHRSLFGNQSVQKMAFLAKTIGQIEYFCEGTLAVIKVKDSDMFHYNLEPDESRDIIDMVMNIESLEVAVLFREDAPDKFKLSIRSKGTIQVLEVAENVGGGGHLYAAGAFIKGKYEDVKLNIVEEISKAIEVRKA